MRDRENYRQWSREWYAKNRERVRDYQNSRYDKHPRPKLDPDERLRRERESRREWQRRNPDARRAIAQTRRARMRKVRGAGVTAAQWTAKQAEYAGLCVYCVERKTLSMDHIEPIALGGMHEPENIAPACRSCNASKKNSSLIVWLAKRIAR